MVHESRFLVLASFTLGGCGATAAPAAAAPPTTAQAPARAAPATAPAAASPVASAPMAPGASAPPARPPLPPDAPAPGPPPGSSPSAKLALRGPATARLGDTVVFELANVDDRALAFHHPGGTSGCDAFRWSVSFEDANRLQHSLDGPESGPRVCTQQIVHPSWIVIEPGKSQKIKVRFAGTVFAADPPKKGSNAASVGSRNPTTFKPGRWTVNVSSRYTREASTDIELTP